MNEIEQIAKQHGISKERILEDINNYYISCKIDDSKFKKNTVTCSSIDAIISQLHKDNIVHKKIESRLSLLYHKMLKNVQKEKEDEHNCSVFEPTVYTSQEIVDMLLLIVSE